jgi:succinyl-diaminopimelate desuccinylase
MEAKELKERATRFQNPIIEAQIRLTQTKAIGPDNGGEGEIDRARLIKGWLGFADALEEYYAPDSRAKEGVRPNLLARVFGKDRSRALWVVSHLDTVPEGDLGLWHSDPFQAYVKDGSVFGRGVEDNQQAIVCSLFASKLILDAGLLPEMDVNLLFLADEETGNVYGIEYLLNEHPTLFGQDDLYVVSDWGSNEGDVIEVAEKSLLWVRVVVEGKQTHASTPHLGNNAHRAGAHLLVSLDSALHARFPLQDPIFSPSTSTFEPTKKEANVGNVNTIPGRDAFCFDCRVLPSVSLEDILGVFEEEKRRVEQAYGVSAAVEILQRVDAPKPTSSEAPVILGLSRALETMLGVHPKLVGIGGGTIAAPLRRVGLQAAVWSKLEGTAHQPNESCPVANMLDTTAVLACMMLQKL